MRIKRSYQAIILFSLILFFSASPYLLAENSTTMNNEIFEDSSNWFRHYGDYLVYLTLCQASPREYKLSISSDSHFFENGLGKRLRIGSPSPYFHWGIEFGLFTSQQRYKIWNFKNICCDGQFGLFGLVLLKPAIFLVEMAHYCSNLLQGAPHFSKPITYSQYFFYGSLIIPLDTSQIIPGIQLIKPYLGGGYYLYERPLSHHLPFAFGLEIETEDFLLPQKGLHLDFHCAFNGMQVWLPTYSLFVGWGTLSEAHITSLPFSLGFFYQWGQDARGQFYDQNRELIGLRLNIIY